MERRVRNGLIDTQRNIIFLTRSNQQSALPFRAKAEEKHTRYTEQPLHARTNDH